MKRLILYILFWPFVLFSQSSIIDIPEVSLFENRLDLHQIGSQQIILDSILTIYSNSLSDHLRMQGPIFVKEYGALSSSFFRGTNASHSQLLWNGISLNSLSHGQVDLCLFPSKLFSEVKLNSGGHSSLSGSGAIGGSIQLNNAVNFNNNNFWDIDFSIGNYGYQNKTISYLSSSLKHYLSFKYSLMETDNDFEYVNIGYPNSPIEIQEKASMLSKQYMLNFAYRTNNTIYGFNTWISDNIREVPVGMLSFNPNAIQFDYSKRNKLYWKYFNENYQFDINHAIISENFIYQSDLVQSNIATNNIISSYEYKRFYNHITLFLGLNNEKRSVKSNNYSSKHKENLTSIYSSLKYIKNKWVWIASSRKEYHPVYTVPILYSLGGNYLLNQSLIWKVKLSKNFKAPTFNDLYWVSASSIGNLNLLPELAQNIETTLNFNDISLTIYSNKIKQMIRWRPNINGFWMPENLEKVWARGFEFSNVFTRKIFNKSLSLNTFYSFTVSTLQDNIISNGSSIGQQLTYVPRHKASTILRLDMSEWRFSFSSSYNDEVNTTSDGIRTLPAYFLSDLIIQYLTKRAPLVLSLKINNLTNSIYQVYEWFPMPGRHFVFNINLKF